MGNEISAFFSEKIRQALIMTPFMNLRQIQEIRLRSNRPVCVTIGGKNKFLGANGGFSENLLAGITADVSDIEYALRNVCEHSVYSYQRELSQCFVTVRGGHRVGIAGTAVLDDSGIMSVPKSISSLNFRIASERVGCADEIYNTIMKKKLQSVLLVGSPMSGKTTVLRDLARQIGNQYRVALIDERSEIAGAYRGHINNDVGLMTDVFDGYDKKKGVMNALRAMSPQAVICDEIGSPEDADVLLEASKCGLSVIASAHASSIEAAMARKSIETLVKMNTFTYIIVLGNNENIGKITGVERFDDEIYRYNADFSVGNTLRHIGSSRSAAADKAASEH
ncbi:MAG: Flp pilus assembly complex ATPase component TadA [Oscillospiraceae bacterium]|nr:Flp pilus assembly complex ATPase component TadA [Oscillospiraceae bacterium]